MKIGLAGCGRWGKLILRDLRELGAEVAVAAPSEATRKAALEAGAVSVHAYSEALPDCDGYVVAVPTIRHAEVTRGLLSRNKPIYVEKPLTARLEDALEIVADAPDRVFCMDKWRYHGGVLKLAELAQSGELGELVEIRSWRLGWGNPHDDVSAIWILAPHDLSIAYEILGFLPPVRSASATMVKGGGESLQGTLQGDTGPRVSMEISSLHPVKRRSLVVIGTKGSAQFGDSYDEVVRLALHGQEPREIPIKTDMPLLAELRAFLGHLAGGPPPKSSARAAAIIVRRISELCDAAGVK
jgi:predicted dehydrogenase